MQIQQGTFCPLVQGECKKWECAFFTQVRGTNPNTGQDIDEWNCAIALMPMLLIEGAQQSRQTGAAVESFRNEVSNNGGALVQMLASAAQQSMEKRLADTH